MCDSKNLVFVPAKIAPFVVFRLKYDHIPTSVEGTNYDTKGCLCLDCGLMFSKDRLSDADMQLLYKGYRDEKYMKQRVFFEPDIYNLMHGFFSRSDILVRQRFFSNFIKNKFNPVYIKNLLDYGGGTGEYIPREFKHAKKYLYDISPDIQTNFNIEVVSNIDNLPALDFIICSNLLEHMSDPKIICRELLKLSNPETVLFIDVPNEQSTNITDFYHEHINLFNISSLIELMNKTGFDIIGIEANSNIYALITPKPKPLTFINKVFSIRIEKKHKVIRVLGLKFKIRRKIFRTK